MMSWKAIDLGEIEARQKAMDLDVVYNQYGQRTPGERRQVTPPAPVESAAWQPAGELDYWVLERGRWWGRVRGLIRLTVGLDHRAAGCCGGKPR